ncbi:MAG TPA: hypothetical protein VFJ65_04255 [Solirubrobacterales bacterium]|nr:hypothetical protein [Solirubrobacterales bacterium]
MEVLEAEAQMSNWNDDKLDHLDRRVDEGFERMEERFDRLNYILITGAIAIIVAMVGFHG